MHNTRPVCFVCYASLKSAQHPKTNAQMLNCDLHETTLDTDQVIFTIKEAQIYIVQLPVTNNCPSLTSHMNLIFLMSLLSHMRVYVLGSPSTIECTMFILGCY
ncbi:hypothetical protein V6Z88_002093 [Aspergillus fumigatus]|jgi:hypothetical protein